MNKLLTGALTYFMARSPRLRKYAPLLPAALAIGAYLRSRRAKPIAT
jgi:hypothetical protein